MIRRSRIQHELISWEVRNDLIYILIIKNATLYNRKTLNDEQNILNITITEL